MAPANRKKPMTKNKKPAPNSAKKRGKAFYAAIIGSAAVLVAIIVTLIILLGGGGSPNYTSGGPEVGVYYYEVSRGEILLELDRGGKFTLEGPDINKSGDYGILNGNVIALDFVRDEDGVSEGSYTPTAIVLDYNGATLTFSKKIEYKVSFETNGASKISPVTVINGKTCTKPGDPVRDGYKLVGWYADEDFVTPFDFDSTVITKDITVYARWIDEEILPS